MTLFIILDTIKISVVQRRLLSEVKRQMLPLLQTQSVFQRRLLSFLQIKMFSTAKKNISIEMTTVITCAKIHCASLQIQLLSVLQRQLFSELQKMAVTCSAKMNVISIAMTTVIRSAKTTGINF